MNVLSPVGIALIALAAVGAGIINTVVGSGSLITFPTLLGLGVPPITANMSNTVGLAVGNIGGILGYRKELRGQLRAVLPLVVVTFVGALVGALALLTLPPEVFHAVAPVLVIVGCVLVGVQPLLRRRSGASATVLPGWSRYPFTAVTGAYGGYFGAAQGVLIVGLLELSLNEPLQRINAIKNVLQTVAGWTATIVFLFTGTLPWIIIGIIAVGALVGSAIGAAVGRRLPEWLLRSIIIVIGILAVIFLVF